MLSDAERVCGRDSVSPNGVAAGTHPQSRLNNDDNEASIERIQILGHRILQWIALLATVTTQRGSNATEKMYLCRDVDLGGEIVFHNMPFAIMRDACEACSFAVCARVTAI